MSVEEHNIAEEMGKMEYEPLQPIEIKLIRWSLIIGVVSLVVLYLVSAAFFPAAHGV
ncbi:MULTISPECIES: hypothetical protein [Pseudodesulfovibrio]|jgi:hypothetical protein|uniref:Uncharacterized protein n=2 Tax=Pseudodesulfovibrio TaxID=2035811 RepID=A0ABV4JZN7_9BACT